MSSVNKQAFRVYIGMINKKNTTELKTIAESFLRRQAITGHLQITTFVHGFIVSFASEREAERCADECEDAELPDAVDQRAMARLILLNEDEGPTIERLEKELWVTVDRKKSPDECDDQIVTLAEFLKSNGMITKEQLEKQPLESLIAFRNPKTRKYSIQLASSAAVIVGQSMYVQDYEENGLETKVAFSTMASSACSFKHRYDINSVLIYLPSAFRVNFEEEKVAEWLRPMEKTMNVRSFQHKVLDPFIWQLFTTSQDEQDKFIGNVKDICGPYRDNILPMAICWLFGTVYKWSPDLLPIEVFQAFAYLDQNFPEDLENIRQQEQKAAQATPEIEWSNDPEIMSDAYYSDICTVRDPVEFSVSRSESRINVKETVKYYDVFVLTAGDEQPALKRRDTLINFETELERFVAHGAVSGMILNYHLSFDTLSGICFYLVFEDVTAARKLLKDVKDKRIYIRNQIQQVHGTPMKTQVKAGCGFDVTFQRGDEKVVQDLKQISEEIMND